MVRELMHGDLYTEMDMFYTLKEIVYNDKTLDQAVNIVAKKSDLNAKEKKRIRSLMVKFFEHWLKN